MRNIKIKFGQIAIVLVLLVVGASTAKSQWYIMESRADSLVQVGIEAIYNINFSLCEKIYKTVQKEYPGNLAGYFLEATSDWWKVQLNIRSHSNDKQFLKSINKVISMAQKELDTANYNLGAIFFKAAAIGYRGRYYTIREQWVNAALDGQEAYKLLTRGLIIAPGNRDMLFGIGYYNYFSKVIPDEMPILKPLLSFVPVGDKVLGIKQLKASSESALYADVEATIVLLQIYYQFEKDWDNALRIAEKLTKRFPNNPFFQKYLGRLLYIKGNFDAAEKVWYKLLLKGSKKTYGYDDLLAREAMYYYGDILMIRGNNDRAIKYLTASSKMSNKVDKTSSGFIAMSHLKLGIIYEQKGNKSKAKEHFKKVLESANFENSHKIAKDHLKKYK